MIQRFSTYDVVVLLRAAEALRHCLTTKGPFKICCNKSYSGVTLADKSYTVMIPVVLYMVNSRIYRSFTFNPYKQMSRRAFMRDYCDSWWEILIKDIKLIESIDPNFRDNYKFKQ